MTIGYYYISYFKSMPQLTISNQTYKVTKGNIERVFKTATKERIAETRKWYSDAQKFTETLSLKFDNQLLIGSDCYVPLCRLCYNKENKIG